MKRNVLNSPRLLELKKNRQRAVVTKIFIYLLGFSAVLGLLSYLFRLDSLNISEVKILSLNTTETEIIKKIVTESISGQYLWLLPKTNILLYPKNHIKNELQNRFKKLKDIKFSIENKKILQVSVTEREAKYLWCEKEEKCSFMDENGFIFDEAPYFSGEVYFKFYGPIGENFKKIILFKKTLEDLKLKPVKFSILENGDAQISLSNKTSLETNPRIILVIFIF